MLHQLALLQRIVKPIPFLSPFFPSIYLFILGNFNCHHSLWVSKGTSDPSGEEVFDWVISSDLLPLNDPNILTLFHQSSAGCSSPDISFASSFLVFSCSWGVLQDMGSDHLPILLTVPLFPVFRLNERSFFFNFQKARRDDFAFYFDFHCPSTEEYCYLFFSAAAAALFTSVTLNAAKFFIFFVCIKR